jgi:hypothetical protein
MDEPNNSQQQRQQRQINDARAPSPSRTSRQIVCNIDRAYHATKAKALSGPANKQEQEQESPTTMTTNIVDSRLTLLPTSLPPSSYHRHDPCRSARCALCAAIYI